jgi:hypothetical protein
MDTVRSRANQIVMGRCVKRWIIIALPKSMHAVAVLPK